MPTEREKQLASDQKEAKATLKARMGKNPMRADVLRFVKYRREGSSIEEASRKVLSQREEEYKSTKKYAKTHGIKGRRRVSKRKTQKKYRDTVSSITTINEKPKSITVQSQNKTYNVTVKSSLPLSSVKNMSACELCEREKQYQKELQNLQEKYKNVLQMDKLEKNVLKQEPNIPTIQKAPSFAPIQNNIKPNTLAIINNLSNNSLTNKNETTPSLFRKNESIVNNLAEVKSISENVVKPNNDDDLLESNIGNNLNTTSQNAFYGTQK